MDWEVYRRQEKREWKAEFPRWLGEVGSRRKRGELCNITQYFAVKKVHRYRRQQKLGGNQDYRSLPLNRPVHNTCPGTSIP